MPYANVERENVIWGYDKSYCERELCDNWEIELYRICRNYKEFIERLGGDRSDKYTEYLPWVEADIAAVGDDVDNNNDLITYLIITCLLYTSRCV